MIKILQRVLNIVPQKFEVFLSAVRELPWLQALAESVKETYEKFKEEAEEGVEVYINHTLV